jgi:hypothetical protein
LWLLTGAFNENTKAEKKGREKKVLEINKTRQVRINQSAEFLEQPFLDRDL